MTDKIEEKIIPAPATEATPVATNEAAQPQPEKQETKAPLPPVHPKMSLGEKWYNRIVYQGINYWVNLGISLVATDYFSHGKGKPWADRKIASLGGAIGKVFNKSTSDRAAHIILNTVALNTGGNLLLIPMKWMEDRKRPIVHWLNKKLGVNQTAADGHEKTPDEIYIEEEQPKQTWMNVIKRRIMAVGSTIVTGLAIDRILRRKLDKPYINDKGEEVTHKEGQEVFTGWITGGADAVLKSGYVPKGEAIAKNDVVKRYLNYAALDTIYTAMTAKVMHMTNGAKKAKMPKELDDDAPALIEEKPNRLSVVGSAATMGAANEMAGRSYVETVGKRPDTVKQILEKPQPSSLAAKVDARRSEDPNITQTPA